MKAMLYRRLCGAGWDEAVMLIIAFVCSIMIAWPGADLLGFQAVFAGSILIGTGFGRYTFGADLLGKNEPFLQYLPLSRSQIWLANFTYGLAWALLASLVLTAAPMWTWTPLERPENPLQLLVLSSRASLFFGVLSVVLLTFCSVSYYRFYSTSDNATMLNAITMIAVVAAWTLLPIWVGITPSMYETFPAAMALASLLALGGYICYAHTPVHWSRLRRFFSASLPLKFVILCVFGGILFLQTQRWIHLEPGESITLGSVTLVAGQPRIVVISLWSTRSGSHVYAVDLETGKRKYLGRNLYFQGVALPDSQGTDRPVIRFSAPVFTGGLAQKGDGIWRPATGELTRSPRVVIDGDRSTAFAQWYPSQNGAFFAALCWRLTAEQESRQTVSMLQVYDAEGRLVSQAPVTSSDVLYAGIDRVVYRQPVSARNGQIFVVDLSTGNTRSCEVPGRIIAASQKRALALRTQEGPVRRYDLIMVDLEKMEFAPVEATANVPGLDRLESYSNKQITTNCETLVWLEINQEGEFRKPVLWVLNLLDGQKRMIADSSRLPVLPVSRNRWAQDDDRDFMIPWITPDGSAADVSVGSWRYRVSLTNGEAALIQPPSGVDSRYWVPSPGGVRLMTTVTQYATVAEPPIFLDRAGPATRPAATHQARILLRGVFVGEPGKPCRKIIDTPMACAWIDDERIMAYDQRSMLIYHVDGSPPREVFSMDDKLFFADTW